MALDVAMKNLIEGEINVISDTDVVILKRNWDLDLCNSLARPRSLGVIGIPYEDIGGFSTSISTHQTYKRKPTATWMALSPHFDFRHLSMMPDKNDDLLLDSVASSTLYNLPIGFSLLKDVGWQIPGYLEDNQIPFLSLELVKPGSPDARALIGVSDYHDEFHWDGVPYLAHQRGSMSHAFRVDPLSRSFYESCDRYLGQPPWSVFPTIGEQWNSFARRLAKSAKSAIRNGISRMGLTGL
ncbi:MAG: hypothetical protein ACOYLQ_15985 [Hyphomicrobiaceae bacterium]